MDTGFVPVLLSGAIQRFYNTPETNAARTRKTAIAAVLTEMDAELAVLEQRQAKTRALKQGMMHSLLTGRIRLV